MLRDVVRRHCRRWAHAPVIHAASFFYHAKKVAWVSISMHACDPVPTVMGLRLAALRAAGAPLLIVMLRLERVVLKKVRSFTISLSMSISESLEWLPSLYSSTWFSSWSPAQFGQVSSNRVSSRSWAEGIANCNFSPIGCFLSYMLRGRVPACTWWFLVEQSFHVHFFRCCAPILSCVLGPNRLSGQSVKVAEMGCPKT